MNKIKMFFVAAALLLTTAGVFAGKAKFANFTLYAQNGSQVYQISTSSVAFTSLSTTGTVQASITGTASGSPYLLYSANPGTATTKVFASNGF